MSATVASSSSARDSRSPPEARAAGQLGAGLAVDGGLLVGAVVVGAGCAGVVVVWVGCGAGVLVARGVDVGRCVGVGDALRDGDALWLGVLGAQLLDGDGDGADVWWCGRADGEAAGDGVPSCGAVGPASAVVPTMTPVTAPPTALTPATVSERRRPRPPYSSLSRTRLSCPHDRHEQPVTGMEERRGQPFVVVHLPEQLAHGHRLAVAV